MMSISARICLVLLSLLSLRSNEAKSTSESVILKKKVLENARAKASLRSPYWIIIDGGSTGSRLHVFEFVKSNENYDSESNNDEDSKIKCVRRGSTRVDKPLSAFARTRLQIENNVPLKPSYVAEHLLPLFDFATTVIPSQYHATTEVRYEATAGMRLVEEEEQSLVYDALYKGLIESIMESTGEKFPFVAMKPSGIETLSGELEGFYGAVAANYLHGTIDARMKLIDETEMPLGALDMGGSSTQLVFLPEQSDDDDQPSTSESNDLNEDDFFSTSYLSYGVDQVRRRLWNTWVEDAVRSIDQSGKQHQKKTILNPCAFKGFTTEHKGHILKGTGNVVECSKHLNRMIPSFETTLSFDDDNVNGQVGDVEHPPIRGKFFAMSLYFFTLDSLRTLTLPDEAMHLSWPTPSIQELYDALHGFCGRNWHGDLEDIRHTAHKYTNPDVLQHRCLEAVYIVTLLRDGYGFHPSSRDITFSFDIDGSEVEWALGMVLSLYSEKEKNSNFERELPESLRSNSTTEMGISPKGKTDVNLDFDLPSSLSLEHTIS